MNREIKFRVWNTEGECWDNPNILEVWNDSGKLEPFQFIKSGKLNPIYTPIENFIIQQYTGLKDKNGKEIYEGDVIKTLDSDKKTDFIGYIIYNLYNASFRITKKSNYLGLDMFRVGCELEVIGNIFENPELIK